VAVPGGTVDSPLVAHLPFDEWNGEEPFEDRPVRDGRVFSSFAQRAAPYLANLPFDSLLPEYWQVAVEAEGACLATRFSRPRVGFQTQWGGVANETMLSGFCRSDKRGFFLLAADVLLRAGEYRCGLIVNAECGFSAHGRWQFTSVEEFEDYVATYTIGEAATATVIGTSDTDDDFYFRLESIGSAYDLCMIPLPNAVDYMPKCAGPLPRTTKFYSRSKELMTTAINRIAESFRADPVLQSRTYDITFGHEASERATAAVTRILRQRPERHFAIHREYGNAVAASVPLAMSLALEQGRLQRGHQVLIVVAASGITIGFAAFTF
jgi:hypothetical protein